MKTAPFGITNKRFLTPLLWRLGPPKSVDGPSGVKRRRLLLGFRVVLGGRFGRRQDNITTDADPIVGIHILEIHDAVRTDQEDCGYRQLLVWLPRRIDQIDAVLLEHLESLSIDLKRDAKGLREVELGVGHELESKLVLAPTFGQLGWAVR